VILAADLPADRSVDTRLVAARRRPFVASAAGAIALARARALTVSIDPRLFAASSGGG
jgi:hypothetical protein